MFGKSSERNSLGIKHKYLNNNTFSLNKCNLNEDPNFSPDRRYSIGMYEPIIEKTENTMDKYSDLNVTYFNTRVDLEKLEKSLKNIHIKKDPSKLTKFNRMLRKKMFGKPKCHFNETKGSYLPDLAGKSQYQRAF